jgi:DNA-binding NarL/FixJ family response regulator
VYRYFLGHPDHGLVGVSAELGLDHDTLEAAVEQLESLRLIDASDCKKVLVADPEVGIERLIEERLRELHEETRDVLAARAIIGTFQDTRLRTQDSSHMIERVEDQQQVRKRLEDLAFFSDQETLYLHPSGALPGDLIEAARPFTIRALRRGTELRGVFHPVNLKDHPTAAFLCELIDLGAEIRIADVDPDRLLVYNRALAVVPLDPGEGSAGALFVQEPGLISQLVARFESVWETGRDLAEFPKSKPADPGLSALEKQVLDILTIADKDEIAAREMGVSVRTFRRYVADLMTRLGASSRFQAALLAKSRGWM